MAEHQSYYVPEQSKLPLALATVVAMMIVGAAGGFNAATYGSGNGSLSWYLCIAGFVGFCAVLFVWFGTAIKENRAGLNSEQLKRSYVIGMYWFIFSEVMFFACFFGVLFYVRNLSGPWLAGEGSNFETGKQLWEGFVYSWPPEATPQQAVGGVASQIQANTGVFNAPEKEVPLLLALVNTALLLTSSVTCHFAHTAMKNNNRGKFNAVLGLTLILGFTFVAVQAYEYYEAYVHLGLTLESGIYGSTFFILTGFHGFHVCMGAIMLSVQWLRSVRKGHFSSNDQFGFEASSWYWHFVDVVWVGLFLFVYII
jgi:cytochrome c oxidase subunit 3